MAIRNQLSSSLINSPFRTTLMQSIYWTFGCLRSIETEDEWFTFHNELFLSNIIVTKSLFLNQIDETNRHSQLDTSKIQKNLFCTSHVLMLSRWMPSGRKWPDHGSCIPASEYGSRFWPVPVGNRKTRLSYPATGILLSRSGHFRLVPVIFRSEPAPEL